MTVHAINLREIVNISSSRKGRDVSFELVPVEVISSKVELKRSHSSTSNTGCGARGVVLAATPTTKSAAKIARLAIALASSL